MFYRTSFTFATTSPLLDTSSRAQSGDLLFVPRRPKNGSLDCVRDDTVQFMSAEIDRR